MHASGLHRRPRLEPHVDDNAAAGLRGCLRPERDGSTTSYTYDAASRLTTTGYVYDALGRTTTVPAGDAGGKPLAATYYVNDLVRSLTPENGVATTWSLDPTQQRFRSWTQGSSTKVNHFADDGDAPVWVAEGGSAWTRNIRGITGSLVAVQDSGGSVLLQLTNLRGAIIATATTDPNATGVVQTFDASGFGASRTETTRRYGWLGGQLRPSDPTGVVLMGVRLYNPSTGRFLQKDPVFGGSDNPYDYAGHDPVNNADLDGRVSVRKIYKAMKRLWQTMIDKDGRGVSTAAREVAKLAGAKCTWHSSHGIWACTGAKFGYAPRSGGTIFYDVFITPSKSVSESTLRHEAKHKKQYQWFYRQYGGWTGFARFWQSYFVAEVGACVTGTLNLFELGAGASDGNYDPHNPTCFGFQNPIRKLLSWF